MVDIQFPDLRSDRMSHAVSSIQRRAEKITDEDDLQRLLVPTEVLQRLNSSDSQLVLGRRGTGKTHMLRVFSYDCCKLQHLAYYCDCTRLGSGLAGMKVSPQSVAQKYFNSILSWLCESLWEDIEKLEAPERYREDSADREMLRLIEKSKLGDGENSYDYATLTKSVESLVSTLQSNRLYIIIDEWAQIPYDAQPYVAEYLKRSLNCIPSISLKILAVNYQCQFSLNADHSTIGLQRGADLPDVIELDHYFVILQRQESAINFFIKVLYRHLGVSLEWPISATDEEVKATVSRLFTQYDTLVEIIRAAEGNCRDFLCIFNRAYFDHFMQSTDTMAISKRHVMKAATSWFETEKLANVKAEPDVMDTIAYLINEVLKGYKSRSFLVEESKSDHPRLNRMLNERLLHKLPDTYSHPDRPGVRHYIYTIDYAAYARLRGTVNAINEKVFYGHDEDENDAVPMDDKRSIRRIIFDPDSEEIEGSQISLKNDYPDLPLWIAAKGQE